MCGIAGVLRVHPPGNAPPPLEAIPESWLDILDDSIKHRGPDGHARFRDRAIRSDGSTVDVAFVHRRLAIIDLADGHQPMVSQRGRSDAEGLIAVVFNGCIYNHRELRRELERTGHHFETDHSDTEVLVHGYRQWGRGFPRSLDGMFAFALWSPEKGLLLARDQSGEKPLYYADELPFPGIAFASTPAALATLMKRELDVSPNFESSLLTEWLRFGFGRGTPSWDIQAVHKGASFQYGGPDEPLERFCGDQGEPSEPLDVERTDRLLAASVKARLEADVPLGCFLSGGVDSSLLAWYAQRELGPSQRLKTFTVRMPDRRYDESEFGARAAAAIGAEHSSLDPCADPAADLVDLITRPGLPLGDSSILPSLWVSRAARSHVKVALSGDGGDELFYGYERHIADRWLRRNGTRLAMLAPFLPGSAHPTTRRAKFTRLAHAARGAGYLDLVAIFPQQDLEQLRGPVPLPVRQPAMQNGRWFDVTTYLPDDLLRKTDTASMSVALEVRAPFLSNELVSAAWHTSEATLMPRGQRKGLLRQVARRYLPAEIVDRPKQGFAIPIGEWFRSDYGGMKQLLMDHLNSTEPWGPPSLGIELNMKFVRRMLDDHMNERRDHSQRLYMLLVLSIWAKWVGSL